MSGNKVYSPTQAAAGAFLGGPLASVFFILKNFITLDDQDSIKKTKFYGALTVAVILLLLPFLPDKFPNLAIPLATIISTRLLIEKFQFKKDDILENEALDFHSNWRVLFVGLICLVLFMVVAVCLILFFDALGLTSVT